MDSVILRIEFTKILRMFMYIDLAGITLSPARFSSLDWTDYKDEQGIIAGGNDYKYLSYIDYLFAINTSISL